MVSHEYLKIGITLVEAVSEFGHVVVDCENLERVEQVGGEDLMTSARMAASPVNKREE